jgi:hypothetical protein
MSLTPLRSPYPPRPRAQQQQPAPKPRVDIEHLTTADVAGLSFETIGMLVKENPKLVANMIVDAAKMRRAEMPMNPSTLRPVARAIVLSGERRRGRELNAEEAAFMADFLESIGAS